jgi:hypothetical protein
MLVETPVARPEHIVFITIHMSFFVWELVAENSNAGGDTRSQA